MRWPTTIRCVGGLIGSEKDNAEALRARRFAEKAGRLGKVLIDRKGGAGAPHSIEVGDDGSMLRAWDAARFGSGVSKDERSEMGIDSKAAVNRRTPYEDGG